MASINPLNTTLDLRKAKHLLRRATFNYSKEQLDAFIGMTASDAVLSLTTASENTLEYPYDPIPVDAPDGYWVLSDKSVFDFKGNSRKNSCVTAWWWHNAMQQTTLKHKLSFFLHTCFTVSKNNGAGPSTFFYDHIRLLDFYALGNIKVLAKKITLDNSMLRYLDNDSNKKNNPNENYAREFLELFTILKGEQIGEGDYTNYTEEDIQETARVFSGYVVGKLRDIIDNDTGIPKGYPIINRHDTGDKTFSQSFDNHTITGASDETDMIRELHDFVDMLFNQEETAKSYCRKLYRFFVKSSWDETIETDIISPMSKTLIDNNYEILPVVIQLLSSAHFYDADDSNPNDNIIGGIIKSPLQLLSEIFSVFDINYPNPETDPFNFYNIFYLNFVHNDFFKASGMGFYDPESVAGYPAYYQAPNYDRIWFSSNTIIGRYKLIDSLIRGRNSIVSGNKSISTQLDSLNFAKTKISDPSVAAILIKELSDLLYPEPIDKERLNYFKAFLVDDFDEGYWEINWTAYINSGDDSVVKLRLEALIIAMVNAPEFQLM